MISLQVRRSESLYWKVDHPEHYSHKVFPTFAFYDDRYNAFYGLPIYEYPGLVKVGVAYALLSVLSVYCLSSAVSHELCTGYPRHPG